MQLKKSPKKFANFKSDTPSNTIAKIKNGFKNLGFQLRYTPITFDKNLCIYSGHVKIVNTDFGTNGKGITPELAKASALAELAERFSSGLYLDHTFLSEIITKKNVLFGDIALDEDVVKKFVKYGYLDGYIYTHYKNNKNKIGYREFLKKYNLSRDELNKLKEKEFSYHWVNAYSLNKKKYFKIPLNFVTRISGSNGLAAGNTYEEAIVQGAYEIFERYCLIKILKNKMKAPTIKLNSIKNKKILDLINFFKYRKVDIIIKDFTLGNKFPVIGVIFINRNLYKETNTLKKNLYFKRIRVGAHLDLNEALTRCFTEEVQGYTVDRYLYHKAEDVLWNNWIIKMNRKYKNPHNYYIDLFRQYDFYDDISFLEDKSNLISFNELNFINHKDFLHDVNELIKICENENWNFLVVNFTHHKLNIPVIRVIIPSISDIIDYYSSEFNLSQISEDNNFFNLLNVEGLYNFIIDDNWTSNYQKKRELIKILENHLSLHLNKYILHFDLYGLRKYVIFEILAFTYLAINKYKEALNYFLLIKNIYQNTQKYDKIINILEKDTAKKNIFSEISYKNPFASKCKCAYCRFDYPKVLYKLICKLVN